jgi:hypothetical protein
VKDIYDYHRAPEIPQPVQEQIEAILKMLESRAAG